MSTKPHIAMYIGSLQKGGAERVMVNLADYFFEQGYKVTLVTTYLAPEEYEVKHAAWKVVPAGADRAVQVCDPDENPAWVDPDGGQKDGIKRVFSALLKQEQEGRLKNLQKRKDKLTNIWKELKPDIVHCHDWQTGMIPLVYREFYKGLGKKDPKFIYTIHNAAFLGLVDRKDLYDYFNLNERLFDILHIKFK